MVKIVIPQTIKSIAASFYGLQNFCILLLTLTDQDSMLMSWVSAAHFFANLLQHVLRSFAKNPRCCIHSKTIKMVFFNPVNGIGYKIFARRRMIKIYGLTPIRNFLRVKILFSKLGK